MHHLRKSYPTLLDGLSLTTLQNWTSWAQLPGSNGTATEFGVWSVERTGLANQTFTGAQGNTTLWLLYSNLNDSITISEDCADATSGIQTPYPAPDTLTNLFYPSVLFCCAV